MLNENASVTEVEQVGPALGRISRNIDGRLVRFGVKVQLLTTGPSGSDLHRMEIIMIEHSSYVRSRSSPLVLAATVVGADRRRPRFPTTAGHAHRHGAEGRRRASACCCATTRRRSAPLEPVVRAQLEAEGRHRRVAELRRRRPTSPARLAQDRHLHLAAGRRDAATTAPDRARAARQVAGRGQAAARSTSTGTAARAIVDGLPATHSPAYDAVYVDALDIDYDKLSAQRRTRPSRSCARARCA